MSVFCLLTKIRVVLDMKSIWCQHLTTRLLMRSMWSLDISRRCEGIVVSETHFPFDQQRLRLRLDMWLRKLRQTALLIGGVSIPGQTKTKVDIWHLKSRQSSPVF